MEYVKGDKCFETLDRPKTSFILLWCWMVWTM